MESRKINVMFQKSGSGSISTRISVPKSWIDQMGITKENRGILIEFDGKKIIIRKPEDE